MALIPTIPYGPLFPTGPYQTMINSLAGVAGQATSMLKMPAALSSAAADATATQSALLGIFPPAVPGVPSAMSSFSSVTTSVTEYATDKLSKVTTELPVMSAALAAQEKINNVDGLAAGNVAAGFANTISNAFAPGAESTSPAPCPALNSAGGPFSALMTGGPAAMNGAISSAVSGLNSFSASTMAGISAAMTALGFPSPPATTGQQLMDQLKAFGGNTTVLRAAITASVPSFATELVSVSSSMVSGLTSVASSFADSVAAELKSVKDMFNLLAGVNFLNLLSNPSPCIASITSQVVNFNVQYPTGHPQAGQAIDAASAVAVAEKPTTAFNVPAQTAVATVRSGRPIAERPIEPQKEPEPPATNPNKYTQAEIDNLKRVSIEDYYNPLQELKAGGAAEIKTIEEWKIANDYYKKQQAAGATNKEPAGTSTDPAAIAAWDAVWQAYQPLRSHYNNVTLPPINDAEDTYKAVYLEYTRRRVYGKTPYTRMAQQGCPLPEDQQTTYLGTGK